LIIDTTFDIVTLEQTKFPRVAMEYKDRYIPQSTAKNGGRLMASLGKLRDFSF
jgi:hypothetical protein